MLDAVTLAHRIDLNIDLLNDRLQTAAPVIHQSFNFGGYKI